MDVFEQKPEPPRKRKSRAKKVVVEPVISAGLDIQPATPDEQAQVSGVQSESKAAMQKENHPPPRKRKTVAQQTAASRQVSVADQTTAQTLPVTPHSSVGDSPQAVPASSQPVILSAAVSADVPPAGVEKGVSSVSTAVKVEEKEAVSPGTRMLQGLLKGGGWLVNLCSTAIVAILLGFSPPVTSIPILDFIQRYKLTTLVILSIVVVLTLVLLLVWPLLHKRLRPIDARLKAMGAVTSISTLSSMLCLSLLIITLFRPPWCPTSLCAAPKVITKPITTTQGSHDANLDVYFVSFESSAYVIPGDPQKPAYIPSSGDPRSVGAVLLDAPKTSTPYTIAIGLHSLNTGRFSIFIDKVTLLLTKVSQVPHLLHVYPVAMLSTNNATNPARFIYQGQQARQTIADSFSSRLSPRVVLRSGEPDQIDATIEARTPVDMQFVIQVTYHIATEQQRFTLTLNNTFEAVFSRASNWQKYRLNLAQSNFVPVSGSNK